MHNMQETLMMIALTVLFSPYFAQWVVGLGLAIHDEVEGFEREDNEDEDLLFFNSTQSSEKRMFINT